MGLRWKWSILEVFLQIIVAAVGPLPNGKYGADKCTKEQTQNSGGSSFLHGGEPKP